jgi:hypothetical protein
MQEPLDSRIERYLMGRMNEAERANFEREMHARPEVAIEVEIQRRLMGAVRHARKLQLKRNLASAIVESAREEKQKKLGFRIPAYSWMAVAAVFIVAILSAVLVINSAKTKKDKPTAGNIRIFKPDVNIPIPSFNPDSAAHFDYGIESTSTNKIAVNSPPINLRLKKIQDETKINQPVITNSQSQGALKSTSLSISNAKDSSFPVTLLPALSGRTAKSYTADTVFSDEVRKTYKIQVTFEPNAEPGYMYMHNRLMLYGVAPNANVHFYRMGNVLYMTWNDNVYQILYVDSMTNFVPVTDKNLLKAFDLR